MGGRGSASASFNEVEALPRPMQPNMTKKALTEAYKGMEVNWDTGEPREASGRYAITVDRLLSLSLDGKKYQVMVEGGNGDYTVIGAIDQATGEWHRSGAHAYSLDDAIDVMLEWI